MILAGVLVTFLVFKHSNSLVSPLRMISAETFSFWDISLRKVKTIHSITCLKMDLKFKGTLNWSNACFSAYVEIKIGSLK